jgi:hypothetical protein
MPHPDLAALHQEFLAAPFPRVGGSVGVFAAYDGFLAGYASRAVKGEAIASSALPEPDQETTSFVRHLQASRSRTADETNFLLYFDLLERVRKAISDEPVDLHVPLLDEGTDVWVIARGQRVGPRAYLLKSFEIDLAARDATPAFGVGARVHVDGGDAQWSGDAIVGATPRVVVREAT